MSDCIIFGPNGERTIVKDYKGWSCSEEIGIAIVNPRGVRNATLKKRRYLICA